MKIINQHFVEREKITGKKHSSWDERAVAVAASTTRKIEINITRGRHEAHKYKKCAIILPSTVNDVERNGRKNPEHTQNKEKSWMIFLVSLLRYCKKVATLPYSGVVGDLMLMWEFMYSCKKFTRFGKCNVCVSLRLGKCKIITYKLAMIFMAGCGHKNYWGIEKDRKHDRERYRHWN